MPAWLLGFALVAMLVIGLGATVRWLIGAPVGYVRTVLTGLIGLFVIVPALFAVIGTSEVMDLETVASADEPPVGMVLVVIVAALWVLALGGSFLAVLEFLWPTHRRVGIVRRVSHIRDRLRRTIRYVQIVRVATRHGLGPLLRGQPTDSEKVGPSLVAALTDAGVTFVKLGQVLATREDIVPPAVAPHLSALQSQVAPEPWPDVEAALIDELGHGAIAEFARFDEVPLAAASIGQVHGAVLLDGDRVAVKVQRPRAAAQVRTDIDIAMRICRRLEARSSIARTVHATRLMDELADSLRGELDYRREARNQLLLAAASRNRRSSVQIPRVYTSLSSARVLTVERIAGTPLSNAGFLLASLDPHRRKELALSLVDELLQQILVDGIFHADLHPGNIMITPSGGAALIDFGAVSVLSREERASLATLLASFRAGDANSAVVAIRQLTMRGPRQDTDALLREVGELFTVASIERDVAALSGRLIGLLTEHDLALPGSLAAALRSLATLQQAIELLDGELDYIDLVLERGSGLVRSLSRPDQWHRVAVSQALTVTQLASRLPLAIDNGLRATEHDRPPTAADVEKRRFHLRVGAAFGGCLLAAGIGAAGLALVLSESGPSSPTEVPTLAVAGFALGALAVLVGTRCAVVIAALIEAPFDRVQPR